MAATDAAAASATNQEFSERIVTQLDRILSSKVFRQADRLKRFLTFAVNETLAGRGEQLKEFVIGVEVFGKGAGFDPRNDPIVRVQARRLRGQLSRYYRDEGQSDEILIELPKGGYTPSFRSFQGTVNRRSGPSALVSRNTILLVPFADHSAAGDQKYFCDGLTQEIVCQATGIEAVRLVAFRPTGALGAEHEMAPQSEATRNSAAVILTGSVRRSGNDLRIAANLIDTASGCYEWSASFDRKAENIFAVQQEIAGEIVGHLRTVVEGTRTRRLPGNLAAHSLYTQGRYHLNQRTEDGLRKALEFFEKAVAEDAQYALAYSGLSDAYALLGHYGLMALTDVCTKAASHATWAVLQDENSAEAHTSLAHAKATQDWDWASAESEFRRAISLDGRYATAHHWFATSCLTPQGRLDEAMEHMLIAQALDPTSSIIARDVASNYYFRRDLSAALDQSDHTVELNPHFPQAYWILGLVQEARGDFDESAAAFQRAISLSPQSPRMHAALGRTYALSGKHAEAERILKELHERAAQRYDSPFDLASLYLALGDHEKGFYWLTQAFHVRCFEVASMPVDPRFDSVREDPRFTALVAQLRLTA